MVKNYSLFRETPDYDQGQYEREISLDKILSDPNTQTKDALIFEIRPSGRINVFKK